VVRAADVLLAATREAAEGEPLLTGS